MFYQESCDRGWTGGGPRESRSGLPMDGRRVKFALGSIFSTALKLTAKTRPLRCHPSLLDAHITLPSSPNPTNLILFVHRSVPGMSALGLWLSSSSSSARVVAVA